MEEDVYVKPARDYESRQRDETKMVTLLAHVNQAKIGSEQAITRWRISDSYQLGRTHAFMSTDQMTA